MRATLLLRIERSQLRWLGHLFRMPPGRLPREVFQACPTGRRPRGRPRTRWRDYVSRLAWERLGIPPEELEEVSGDGTSTHAAARRFNVSPRTWRRFQETGGYSRRELDRAVEGPQAISKTDTCSFVQGGTG
ncbi:hypothetical protein L3Q82_001226 [Scortum barcoo]|uniref:Uncharacterized protein n=1 Tax=Scortum barcoo TaxID=214431 RepID=A0ACB8W9S0_9TELE|nr:hypothetical protein L3Q82_001226 [Scortum barcoo]